MRDFETIRREEIDQPVRRDTTRLDRNQLLYELHRLCPEALALLPHVSSYKSGWINSTLDGTLHPAFQIGRILMRRPGKALDGNEMFDEYLVAVDIGACTHDMPQLVCYASGGGDCVQQRVKAEGFRGTDIFAEFITHSGGTAIPLYPKIDDPMIVSLIQFVHVIRGHRTYYVLDMPEAMPVPAQLSSLTQAIFVATTRARNANRPILSIEAPTPSRRQVQTLPQSWVKPVIGRPRGKPVNGVKANEVRTNRVRAIASRANGTKMDEGTVELVRTLGATANTIRATSESTVSSIDSPRRDSPGQNSSSQSEDDKSNNKVSPATPASSSPEAL